MIPTNTWLINNVTNWCTIEQRLAANSEPDRICLGRKNVPYLLDSTVVSVNISNISDMLTYTAHRSWVQWPDHGKKTHLSGGTITWYQCKYWQQNTTITTRQCASTTELKHDAVAVPLQFIRTLRSPSAQFCLIFNAEKPGVWTVHSQPVLHNHTY